MFRLLAFAESLRCDTEYPDTYDEPVAGRGPMWHAGNRKDTPMMTLDELQSALLNLPIAERLQMLTVLEESVEEHLEDELRRDVAMMEQQLAAFEDGTVTAAPWEEVRARLLSNCSAEPTTDVFSGEEKSTMSRRSVTPAEQYIPWQQLRDDIAVRLKHRP